MLVESLLYVSVACQQAEGIVLRMRANEKLSDAIKVELVETMKEATPECPWDAND
jgi:ferredoxin|tara:strand:- start:7 stop:171 length:165 start_codon:yes stop_codon:yes gene_type:complete